jgi:hypothetical protein
MTTGPDRPISGEVIDPAGPVFVLTSARSGSTLMRYLLDAHPELACPAETGLPSLGLQLASSLMIMNGAPKPSLQATSLAGIPEPVVSRVRATLDSMMGQYLADRNKRRFCEKSLGTAKFADLLIRLYPDVRFIGLVRHVMDFIASAAEANPWGPLGYGFDEYVTGGSGNMVRNLACLSRPVRGPCGSTRTPRGKDLRLSRRIPAAGHHAAMPAGQVRTAEPG